MKPLHIFLIAVISCISPSCKKFLAQYSQNQTFIGKATDLDELLIGGGYPTPQPEWTELYVLDDDIEHNPTLNNSSGTNGFIGFGTHFWQKLTTTKGDGTVSIGYGWQYNTFYARIATLNTVLYNIPALREKNQPENILRRVSGEAHFLRAYYYFFLINIYGKPYTPASASTDYGVPLKTSPDVQMGYMKRASVKEVYDQIVADLLDAEKELEPVDQKLVLRASQAAVQALLSRVYLYREEYDNAVLYADKILKKKFLLRDINSLPSGSVFMEKASPEIIFSAISSGNNMYNNMMDPAITASFENYRVSEDLLSIYSAQDLRLQAFSTMTNAGDHLARKSGETFSGLADQSTIRLPEVYLNKAEALAILGRNEEAITTIQQLRRNRFKPEDVRDINLSGAQLVQLIRDERRRELCFEQHRWLDLRRYGVNSRFPFGKTIRHRSFSYSGSGRFEEGYYELKPYAQEPEAYVQPIPDSEIEFNRGSIKNETRPERLLVP